MARATNVSDIVDGEVELVATGFTFTEGPVWHPDGFLIFLRPRWLPAVPRYPG